MRNQIFLDSVFIIALVNADDDLHQQASRLSTRYEGYSFIVTDAVLLEIGNALARNHKQGAVETIEGLLISDDVEVVHLTPRLFQQALAVYKAYQDKAWGLVDCISFVVMKEAGVTAALTFDRHFEQAGFQVLMREDAST
ncbi:MAG TPA: PIN domain-containing protein [Chloroflexia bacterium]|nr:PIN domain-containing protein [Chloroflexia bacterium]